MLEGRTALRGVWINGNAGLTLGSTFKAFSSLKGSVIVPQKGKRCWEGQWRLPGSASWGGTNTALIVNNP